MSQTESLATRQDLTVLINLDLPPLHRPYYGHMTPELYATGGHMLMSPDVYPPNGYAARASSDQHPNNNYLPSVSYSLDHLDRLDYQVLPAIKLIFFSFICFVYRFYVPFHAYPLQGPEMLAYQPNSESCLIGCYNTEETKNFHRKVSCILFF